MGACRASAAGPGSYARVMATLTHALTHSATFARIAKEPASNTLVATALRHELLHGVAAQDAFVALFDEFPDFEALAREATQAPIEPDPPTRRERTATWRGVRSADTRTSAAPPRSHRRSGDSPSGTDHASGTAGTRR